MEITDGLKRRFWSKVIIRLPHECWEWTGTHNNQGYGLFWPERRTTKPAHRIAYIISNGDPGDDKWIDHKCDNRGCVNPTHLQAVTPKQNSDYGRRSNYDKKCKRGHDLDKWARYRKDGRMAYCLQCNYISSGRRK